MSRFNTLLHGSAADAANLLGGDNPPDSTAELRAALTNALDRIDRLERRMAETPTKPRAGIRPPAICFDCGTTYLKKDIGQTCGECHRGVIE